MVERQGGVRKAANKEAFDERYMGLSRAEVLLREKMAKRYGRQAKHLDATLKESASGGGNEETKQSAASRVKAEPADVKPSQQPVVDPSQKLRQLQLESEKYRASIASGNRMLPKAPSEQLSSQQKPQQYQFKFMQRSESAGAAQDFNQQNSRVVETSQSESLQFQQTSQSSEQNQSAMKNLELLKSILLDFTAEELQNDIFTLNEVMIQTADQSSAQSQHHSHQKQSRKGAKQSESSNNNAKGGRASKGAHQPTAARPQIVLNEKQFNLIKKVYPQAFQCQQAQVSSPFGTAASSSTMQFALQDPQLIIQFFANMQALYRKLNQ